uniref:G-protein alpha subunit n=1 Tax=Rhabditophanes sp. KR3021 TaxID=114890 RepID=A0AC35TUM4_9BILA
MANYAALKELYDDVIVKTEVRTNNAFYPQHFSSYFLNLLTTVNFDNTPAQEGPSSCIGVHEASFKLNHFRLIFYDVSCQLCSHKKWIHQFNDIHFIVYVVSLADFDELTPSNSNKMHESMNEFERICNNNLFEKKRIILLFNKIDLFKNKITLGSSISQTFGDYDGPNEYESMLAFVKEKFKHVNKNSKTFIWCHQTCATDITAIDNDLKYILLNALEIMKTYLILEAIEDFYF